MLNNEPLNHFKPFSVRKIMNRLSFRIILVYFFAFLFICAISVFAIVAYLQTIDTLRKEFTKNTSIVFQGVKKDLVSKLSTIELTLKFISNDQRVQNLNSAKDALSNRELSQFLSDCIQLNNYTTGVDSHYIKNLMDDLIFYSKDRVIVTRRSHFSVFGIEKYLTPGLLSKTRLAQGQVLWSGVFFNASGSLLIPGTDEKTRREELNQIAVSKYVTDKKFKTEIGYLIASVNLAGLSSLVEDIRLGDTGRIYIIDDKMRVLAGWDKSLIFRPLPLSKRCISRLRGAENGSLEGLFQGKKSYVTFEEIGVNGWKLVGVINNREFQEKALVIGNGILLDGLIIIMILVIAAVFVANRLSQPLQNICAFLKQVENGDLNLRTHETGSIEIQNLSVHLNQMIDRINQLMAEIYQEQLFKRKVALKALHAQINPHFLYNTLESISWMVNTGKRETAVMLIDSLSSFFRLSLSGGRDIVTIQEELEHAENYLKIQQIRYQDKLDYIFDVDDEIKPYRILKITLQPLIENAIYHGIKPKTDGMGRVYVYGSRIDDARIKLAVVDNGVGMSEEKLAKLDASLSETKFEIETSGKGYSIENINSRIKLYFGKEYGLQFSSKVGVGTRVEILLPVDSLVNPPTDLKE